MSLSITDLKKGTIFQYEGAPYKVIEYSQKVMGRGGSIVSVKIKHLIDGRVLDKTFKGSETLQDADVVTKKVQYLYNDDATYFFMDEGDYSQYEVPKETVGDYAGYLKESATLHLLLFNGQPVSVVMPKNVELGVTYAEEVVRGDTTGNLMKNAQLETGITVKVPAFIKSGDVVSVDTETGGYRERIK